MVGLLVLVVQYLQRLPSTIDLDYRINGLARHIKTMRTQIIDSNGNLAQRALFDYFRRQTPDVQKQQLQLQDGDYRVLIDLTLRDGVPAALRRQRGQALGASVWRIERPLIVRGSGAATVYLEGS